jgi:hypothetical protein
MQLIALTGLTLAATCSFSSLITSAAALALCLGVTSRLALLGARGAHDLDRRDTRCSFSIIITLSAVLTLGLDETGSLALLGACSSSPSAWTFLALGVGGVGGKAALHCAWRACSPSP